MYKKVTLIVYLNAVFFKFVILDVNIFLDFIFI